MMNAYRKKAVALATVMALAVSLGQVHATESTPTGAAQTTPYTAPSLGKVNISNTANFEVFNVQELEQTTNKIVSFTLRLTNKSTQGSINFNDYWVRLKSKGGTSFTVSLVSENKDQQNVAAGTHQDYRFYAIVNKTTKLSDLQFNLIAWDFSQSNFERLLGTINVPATYTKSVPVNRSYTVVSDKGSFNTSVKRVATGKNDKSYLPNVTIIMENAGAQAITGMNLQFQLRSKSGLFYPLKSTVTEATVFNPLEKKELTLTGVVPVEAGGDGWQLVLTQTVTSDKGSVTFPLASYDLPATTAEDVSIGSEQTFSTEKGTYTAVLTNLTRVPWEDQDLLVSNVSIKNKGTTPLPVPNLTGSYKLDEVIDSDAELVQFDKVLTIAPGSEMNVQFVSKVPYTYSFQKIALALEEKAGEGTEATTTELIRFHHSSELMSIPSVAFGKQHTVEAIGKRAAVTVRTTDTFGSSSAKLVNAVVDITNLEKRYTPTGTFVGQFQTVDGAVYPATIVKPDTKVAPNGKALVSFQASIPNQVDLKGLKLLLGEAVETTTQPTNGETGTVTSAYVNPVLLDLPKEITEPKKDTKEINVYPYKISFERFGTQVNFIENKVQLEFNYTLERDFTVEANTTDRKIIVEIQDPKTKFGLTYELKLDDGKAKADNDGTPTTDMLMLGTHSMELTKIDEDFMFKLDNLQNYTLNIYDQVKPGYKKLIATKSIRWFTISD
ncbi:hypothetical protein FE782_19515 [Paenibacillus antri]|uniref:Uncharacterized protein n=1 Tax=Paenibacillus antri TaxID=2582848 RepID=A0A5R9GBP9_9BACL|nr:hypothetical protein [Paenibacillus antri]TLS50554.1 hypothetical protein FE782_19515 [Paenibacillus antri]